MMQYNLFWIRALKLMNSGKITQDLLIKKTGIKPDTLQSWIYWNSIPDRKSAQKIANALGVTVEYLFHGKKMTEPEHIQTAEPLTLEMEQADN